MRALDVFSTDADPHHVDTLGGTEKPVDNWIRQLARVSTAPVDLFVDVPAQRVVWTFKAREGRATRVNRYLADYDHDAASGEDLFSGFYTALKDLSTSGNWTFPDNQGERWTAGFDLVQIAGDCPGLNAQQVNSLATLISEDTDQLVVGMSSYSRALQVVKDLTARGVDGTIAVNSEGATAETNGIDLVLWPGADRDFQPVDETTAELFSRTGVRRRADMVVADETPSESVTTVQNRYDDGSPIETLVGDTSGRIGALLTVIVGAASVGALADAGPVHPLSGIATLGGLTGAVVGLFVVQGILGLDRGTLSALFPGSGSGARPDGGSSVLATSGWEWQQYSAYTGYWLTLAYAFPTVFRLNDWPFGETTDLAGTLPSAGVFVGALLAVSLAVYLLYAGTSDGNSDHVTNVGSLAVIHACFAAGLVLTAGFACEFWYDAIGFVSGAC